MRRVRQAYSEAEAEKSEARSQEPKARTAEAEARSQRLEARVQSEGTAIVFPSSEMGDCTRPSRKKSEARSQEPNAKTAEAESGQPSAASAPGLSLELARTKSDRHGCSAEVKVQTFQCKGTDSVADSERREASGERRATACTMDGAFPVEPDLDFCQATRTDSDQVVEWTGALVDFTQEEETAADAASTQTPQAGVQNRRGARG